MELCSEVQYDAVVLALKVTILVTMGGFARLAAAPNMRHHAINVSLCNTLELTHEIALAMFKVLLATSGP